MLKRIRNSFSTRLSVFILGVCALIFFAAFISFYHFSSRLLEKNAYQTAHDKLEIINLKIDNVLRRVESAPRNLRWVVANRGIAPDSIYGITRRVIADNPDIYGTTVAFEPYYFKDKGYYYAPYSYRGEGGEVLSLQLGTKDYDYFTWDWYRVPKELGCACWSPPYYDEGGGQMVMCTYSSPIYDRTGGFVGIFTADISLEWLTDMIIGMKTSDASYTFMIAQDGTYIVHHKKERILNQTFATATVDMVDPEVAVLAEDMMAGESGMHVVDNDGVDSYVFYAPVPRTGWSIATVIPKNEVFADLRRNNINVSIIFGLGMVALFLACWRIISRMARPLKKFAVSARSVARGDFNAQLPVIHSHDEMRELADSFGFMQSELTSYIANLQDTTSAKEKIESELRIARDIQMGMIPKIFPPFPARREIDLYATLRPAKEVGGDLYDFFMDGDKLCFAIGDVSGKGVPASLFMAVTRSLFRAVATGESSPGEIVRSLTASISDNNDSNMFVTLFVGILDLTSGHMRFCNAGHNPPVLMTPDGTTRYAEVKANIPVGVMEGFPFVEEEATLADGTCLMLYTDGVTEAENFGKELYGEERLLKLLTAHAQDSPRKQIDLTVNDIEEHVNGNIPSDDITMLALRFDRTHSGSRHTLTIDNRMEEMARVEQFIEQLGDLLSLSPALVMNLNLVLEEAISNIILYGYKPEERKQIEVSAQKDGGTLVLTLTDSGQKFDPTQKEDPDITLSAEERQIGGLGVFLVKKIMNEVEYQRVNGKNVFTMKKTITNQ